MTRNEQDQKSKRVTPPPGKGAGSAPRDPFAILDEMREAFKDVSAEEIEREVAKSVREVREEMRAERQANRKPAPRGA